MKNRRIVMNAVDHVRLSSVIGAMDRLSERGLTEMIALRKELKRAEIVAPHEVPPGVITMNSRADSSTWTQMSHGIHACISRRGRHRGR